MTRTIIIVVAFTAITAALGIGLTKRLVSTAAHGGGADDALTSGSGLTIQISDKPIVVPASVAHLTDLDGRAIDVEALRGKIVLFNFWATWCGPCREEIPALAILQDHYRDRMVIIGMSIDETAPDEVKAFAAKLGVNYPVVIADRQMQQDFGGISSVPSTFVVNRDGLIVQRHLGMLDPRRTEHEVRALAGLPTAATLETVKDTGQVLLANAAYATEIPGVDLAGMTPAQKAEALRRLNTERCTCGCNTTLAQCRINDPTCDTSLPLAQKVAEECRRMAEQ